MISRKAPLRCKKPMKRSGFRQKPYNEAISLRIASQERQKANRVNGSGGGNLASGGLKARTWHRRKRAPTPEELAWRAEVLERDDYTCQWPGCGYRSESNHAHHVNERSQRPDLVLDVDNGATICGKEGRNHHDFLHHTVEGRRLANQYGLLGGTTYEKAAKETQ